MQDLVLIVDQDADERRRASAVLAADGFDVAQRATAIEGVNGVLDLKPGLIILAEETEPLRPQEVISLIRRVTAAPLIVVGSGGITREGDTLDHGADLYLQRPFTVGELAGRARMLIRGRDAPEEERDARGDDESSPVEMTVRRLPKVS